MFPNELEGQAEYEGFRDWLHTFPLYRGKDTGLEDSSDGRVVGKFKVTSCGYLGEERTGRKQNTKGER